MNEHVFVIVPDEFPLEEAGIIGMPFLATENALVDAANKKIVFQRRPKVIRLTNYSTARSRLLAENMRLEHIRDPVAKRSIWEIIDKYQGTFHLEGDPLPCTNLTKHTIDTTDEKLIHVKQYRYPPAHQEEINRQLLEMLEKGIIENSQSPYNSPLWVVPKKADASGKKKWRIVVDFRQLNNKTEQDAYPLPNIEEILDQLGRARYFSAFDLASGFHQIPMDPISKKKTAFSTPQGHYEFARMPFGLKNAPATFQRMMDQALRGLIGKICFVYLDDIVVYGETLKAHNENLEILLERLSSLGLKLQPDKCEYIKPELQYLGHIITQDGVKPNPDKLKAVREFPRPKGPKQIKQFLGLAGYYRRFIKKFSEKAKPLTLLLKKDVSFAFGHEQERAFSVLKDELCSQPLLQYPDFAKELILTTDASNEATGAILSQGKIGEDRPIPYASRTLDKAERNYSATDKELLAIVWAVKHYRPYLYGRKFKIVTDHQPLKWLMNHKDPNSRLMRWRIILEEYDYEIIYKKGTLNTNADALSRNPVMILEAVPPIKWRKNITLIEEIPKIALPIYLNHIEGYSGMQLITPQDELVRIAISLGSGNTLGDYKEYLEEARNFCMGQDINTVAIDLCDLQHTLRGRTEDIKNIIIDLFGNSDIWVYLKANRVLIPETEEEKRQILQENHDST